jgi:hypothetical protein
LFLRILTRYAEKIWDLDNADYFHLMPIEEKCKKAKELAAEAEKESEDEETHPGTPGPTGNESIQDEWKDVEKYKFDTRDIGQLMRINLKLLAKQLAKTIPKPNKCYPSVWDALAWDGLENNLHDIPIHPCVSHMWRAFPPPGNQDPTSETYGCSEYSIKVGLNLHIENITNLIERFDETYKDIVDEMCLSNRDKKKIFQSHTLPGWIKWKC